MNVQDVNKVWELLKCKICRPLPEMLQHFIVCGVLKLVLVCWCETGEDLEELKSLTYLSATDAEGRLLLVWLWVNLSHTLSSTEKFGCDKVIATVLKTVKAWIMLLCLVFAGHTNITQSPLWTLRRSFLERCVLWFCYRLQHRLNGY